MQWRPASALVTTIAVVSCIVFVDAAWAASCSYVSSDFTCSQEKAYGVMSVSGCKCFSCNEVDGKGSYQCEDAPTCGAQYQVASDATSDTPTWSTGAYLAIGGIFIGVSVAVCGVLWMLTRCQVVHKYVAEKPTEPSEKLSILAKAYRFVYAKAFGSLRTGDGKRTRRLTEYWVTECQLLDSFWCCRRSERPRRKVTLRLMRLVSSLLVTASISFFFGTLEFDTTVCSTTANIRLCASSSSRSLTEIMPDQRVTTSSTTSSTTTTINGGTTTTMTTTGNGGSTTTTKIAGNGGSTTTTTTGGGGSTTTSTTSSTSISTKQEHTVQTTNSCASMPSITASFSKPSSIIAFAVTQCVKFVGGYAQNLSKPHSKLDWLAHVLWLAVAAGAIPVSALLSTKLLSDAAFTSKSEKLRMQLILSVTVAAWLQDQIADIFKVPLIYLAKKFGRAMLPSPDSQVVQPKRRELDCLGGQHNPEPVEEEENRPATTVQAVAPPPRAAS